MSEFFLELFSEEIPAGLQKNLREKILDDFKNLFDEKSIKSKKNFSLSCPNRVAIVFEGLDKSIQIKTEEIRGPKVEAPEQALEGFIRSNKIERENLYKECVPILEKLVSINENQEAVKTLMNIYGTLGNNEGFKQMKSLLQ